ncbi:MAG: hypothetical protein DRN04_14595 [Thermoprotei archaeon]|nr:MAG: hypothetical protein DRN04_14595 [Thermoprotei archaeon]
MPKLSLLSLSSAKKLLEASALVMMVTALPIFFADLVSLAFRFILLILYAYTIAVAVLILGVLHRRSRLGKIAIGVAVVFLVTVTLCFVADYLYFQIILEVVRRMAEKSAPESYQHLIEFGAQMLIIKTLTIPFWLASYGVLPFMAWFVLKKQKYLTGKLFTISFGLAIAFYLLYSGQFYTVWSAIASIRNPPEPEEVVRGVMQLYTLAIPTFVISILQFLALRKMKVEGER